MNCQELGRILDEQELRWLPAAERASAEAHLAGCPDCARDHQLDLRLAALSIPPLAPKSLAGWRALANSKVIGRSGRMRNRFIIVGVVAALAAAAAMPGWWNRRALEQPVAVLQPVPAATSVPVAQLPEPAAVASQPAAAAIRKYTVQVRLLTRSIDNAELQAAIDQGYAHFINVLRAGPQLTIVPAEQLADFRVTYNAFGPTRPDRIRPDRTWLAFITVEAAERDLAPEQVAAGRRAAASLAKGNFWGNSLSEALGVDGFAVVHSIESSSQFVPGCLPDISTSQPEAVCSFIAVAQQQAESVRLVGLPADVGLEHQLQQRVGDGTLPWQQRHASMQLLAEMARKKPRGADMDQNFLKGALDLIAATPDASDRATLWSMLDYIVRDLKDPVRLLIDAVPREPDEHIRLDAVNMLAKHFPDDPQVRAAMREMAIADASDLVRNAARQAAGGDSEVREYIVAIVKNASLSPTERLRPLAVINSEEQLKDTLGDESVVRAMVEILPDLARDTSQDKPMMMAIGGLGYARTPSAVDALLAVLRAAEDDLADSAYGMLYKSAVITGLSRHRDDPRAEAALLKIASSDANPTARQAAAKVLQGQ
jgi:hypothetical protein